MGEYSKKIGDRGETIVSYIFKELLGFPHYRSNISIDCSFPTKHAKKEGDKRKTHGIDGLINHRSPLEDGRLDIEIISSKYTNESYPNSPSSKFREYFKELAWTIKCFNHSQYKQEIESSAEHVIKTKIVGVLFWLSNHEDSMAEDITSKIANSRFGGDELTFDKIIFVDNSRASFLVDVLQPLKDKYGKYDFVYPRTGMNNSPLLNENFGSICPLEFLTYNILPLRVVDSYGKKTFILANRYRYDEKELPRIVGLAKTFNRLEATEKTIISFPNFNRIEHQDSVNSALSSLNDESFSSQIVVTNHNLDIRNLGNE